MSIPCPVSDTLSMTYLPGFRSTPSAACEPSTSTFSCLDRELAAIRHGIARVDHQIQDHALELVGIGFRQPMVAASGSLDRDRLTERAAQQVGHAAATVR